MSQVPEQQEILVELFKEKDREMAAMIAGPFNDFTIQVIQSINQSLTIDENMYGETKTFTFNVNSLEKTFKYAGGGTPAHLVISKVNNKPETAIMPYWVYDGKGSITVTIIGTLTADVDYDITFIILAR